MASLLDEGLAHHNAGDLAGAAECYARARTADPSNADALKLLAVVEAERGAFEDGLNYVNAAIELRPRVGEYRHLQGKLHMAKGDAATARRSFEAAAELGVPDRVALLGDLGWCCERIGAWDKARIFYEQALSLRQEYPPTLVGLGRAEIRLGLLDAAFTHFQAALAVAENDAEANEGMAKILRRRGDAVSALKHANRACAIAPQRYDFIATRQIILNDLVPPWHFHMINDSRRLDDYAAAIVRQVKPEHVVLEVGTGSGILAMTAARPPNGAPGPKHVYTCEANTVLADAAQEIIARNCLSDRITVIAKRSTDLVVGIDLPEPADILITETFSSQGLSEGILQIVEDAKGRLLRPGAAIIPAAFTLRGALVASADLSAMTRVDKVTGFDLSTFNAFLARMIPMPAAGTAFEDLSSAVDLLTFDLIKENAFPESWRTTTIPVTAPGLCQGVVQWMSIDLGAGVFHDTRPRSGATFAESSHWVAFFYPSPAPRPLRPGDSVTLTAAHDRSGIRLDFAAAAP